MDYILSAIVIVCVALALYSLATASGGGKLPHAGSFGDAFSKLFGSKKIDKSTLIASIIIEVIVIAAVAVNKPDVAMGFLGVPWILAILFIGVNAAIVVFAMGHLYTAIAIGVVSIALVQVKLDKLAEENRRNITYASRGVDAEGSTDAGSACSGTQSVYVNGYVIAGYSTSGRPVAFYKNRLRPKQPIALIRDGERCGWNVWVEWPVNCHNGMLIILDDQNRVYTGRAVRSALDSDGRHFTDGKEKEIRFGSTCYASATAHVTLKPR